MSHNPVRGGEASTRGTREVAPYGRHRLLGSFGRLVLAHRHIVERLVR